MKRLSVGDKRISSCCTLLLCLPFAQHASGVCNGTPTTTPSLVNIGSYPSQSVPVGGLSSNGTGVSATFGVTCSIGLTLQLLSTTSWLRFTAQAPLELTNGTDTIAYTMASDPGYSPAITSAGQSIGGSTGFQLLTLAVLASGSITIPLYIKTLTTSVWPSAGTYTGMQTLAVDGSMCTGLGLPGVCIGSSPISSNVTLSLTLDVSKSCEFVSVPTLVDFGLISFIQNANTVQLNASMRCTNTEDYLLYADNGNHYSAGSRHMTSLAGNTIAYTIMQPAAPTVPLTAINALSRLGTGAIEAVSIPLKITAGQATPPAGIYTDSVRMVIEY